MSPRVASLVATLVAAAAVGLPSGRAGGGVLHGCEVAAPAGGPEQSCTSTWYQTGPVTFRSHLATHELVAFGGWASLQWIDPAGTLVYFLYCSLPVWVYDVDAGAGVFAYNVGLCQQENANRYHEGTQTLVVSAAAGDCFAPTCRFHGQLVIF